MAVTYKVFSCTTVVYRDFRTWTCKCVGNTVVVLLQDMAASYMVFTHNTVVKDMAFPY